MMDLVEAYLIRLMGAALVLWFMGAAAKWLVTR